jgi:hypothetical protein
MSGLWQLSAYFIILSFVNNVITLLAFCVYCHEIRWNICIKKLGKLEEKKTQTKRITNHNLFFEFGIAYAPYDSTLFVFSVIWSIFNRFLLFH